MPGRKQPSNNGLPKVLSRRYDYKNNVYNADDDIFEDGDADLPDRYEGSLEADLPDHYAGYSEHYIDPVNDGMQEQSADLTLPLPHMVAPPFPEAAPAGDSQTISTTTSESSNDFQDSVDAQRGKVGLISPVFSCPNCIVC